MASQSAVQPHTTSVIAWDVPSAVVAGERFRMKVGIKCSADCPLTSKNFAIYDHEGAQIATGTLPGDHWPGTTGLYGSEVELQTPTEEGLYIWRIQYAGSDIGMLHDEGSASFGVRVVGQPEYLVTIETIDKASQTPLQGARVVMHPYRAVADARGVAELRVAKGAYKLFVSQTGYLTFALPVDVTADLTARAQLDWEPVRERN